MPFSRAELRLLAFPKDAAARLRLFSRVVREHGSFFLFFDFFCSFVFCSFIPR